MSGSKLSPAVAQGVIDSERVYQDALTPGEHSEEKLLLLMEHYLHRARTDHCCPQMPAGAAGSSVRKVAALAKRYIEQHGAPMRNRKAGEARPGEGAA